MTDHWPVTDLDLHAGFDAVTRGFDVVTRAAEMTRTVMQPVKDLATKVEAVTEPWTRLAREDRAVVESTAYEVARRSPGRTRRQYRRAAAMLRGMRKSALTFLIAGAVRTRIGLLVAAIERPEPIALDQVPETPTRRRERTDHQSDPPPSNPRATVRTLIAAPGAPAPVAAAAA